MKQLIIIGAGGLGRCIHDAAKGSIGYGVDFEIKGFIDDNINALDHIPNYPPVLSTISDYKMSPNDVFVCAMGNTQTKRKICESMRAKGANFQKLIHKSAVIGTNTTIGEGSVILEYVVISPDASVGDHSLVQNFTVIGHDCMIGNYTRIDTHCTCVGGTVLKDGATMHTSSILNHHVVVGENAVIGACSFVIKEVAPNTTVWGNPARALKL